LINEFYFINGLDVLIMHYNDTSISIEEEIDLTDEDNSKPFDLSVLNSLSLDELRALVISNIDYFIDIHNCRVVRISYISFVLVLAVIIITIY
jgi:hypothetical protein